MVAETVTEVRLVGAAGASPAADDDTADADDDTADAEDDTADAEAASEEVMAALPAATVASDLRTITFRASFLVAVVVWMVLTVQLVVVLMVVQLLVTLGVMVLVLEEVEVVVLVTAALLFSGFPAAPKPSSEAQARATRAVAAELKCLMVCVCARVRGCVRGWW